ncbi:TPA: hypothetical protein ACJK7B_003209 [Acinetobacter baumannii]
MSLSSEETLISSSLTSRAIEKNETVNFELIEGEQAEQVSEVDIIDNDQFVNRCTFKHPFPHNLISSNFTEKNGNAMSVYWQKHCIDDADIHKRGLQLLAIKLARQPDLKETYRGFVSLPVVDVRSIESSDEFHFDVIYCPDDIVYDIAHSHIQIMKDARIFDGKVPKNTRRELIDEGILKLLNEMSLKEYKA